MVSEDIKTIFITSFHPLISRNILQTGLLSALSKHVHIVIVVPEMKRDYFEKTFGDENIVIEGVDMKVARMDLIFRHLALILCATRTLAIKRCSEFFENGGLAVFIFNSIMSKLFSGKRFAIALFRWLDAAVADKGMHKELFERYKPALVFSTDVQNEHDVHFLRAARRRNIPTRGMVRSWDNLTSKGLIRVVPERLIVNNILIKREAERHDGIPSENISIIGIPHYDQYTDSVMVSRADFFKQWKLDSAKPLIMYAPIGKRYLREHQTDLEALTALSQLDCNILVRMPPTDAVRLDGFASKRAIVAFDEPGIRVWKAGHAGAGRKMNEISEEDEDRLRQALMYADVVVTGLSTIIIDAAVFDTPVISVCFDKPEWDYYESFRRYHEYEHIKPLLESGGVAIVRSEQELLDAVNAYFKDPSKDAEGRRRIIAEEAYQIDGRSTERLIEAIMSLSY